MYGTALAGGYKLESCTAGSGVAVDQHGGQLAFLFGPGLRALQSGDSCLEGRHVELAHCKHRLQPTSDGLREPAFSDQQLLVVLGATRIGRKQVPF